LAAATTGQLTSGAITTEPMADQWAASDCRNQQKRKHAAEHMGAPGGTKYMVQMTTVCGNLDLTITNTLLLLLQAAGK
jgi:hypothetical protein